MKIADCHMHSFFSSDSEAPTEEMVKRAVELGLPAICLTDHYDMDYSTGEFQLDTPAYAAKIRELQEKYHDRIDIRFGVELGLQLHLKERMEEYVNAWPFDYVIGSMHVIDGKDPYYEDAFRDEFFTDISLSNPEGKNIMLLGLDVRPEYRMQGLGRELVSRYSQREAQKGRKKLFLTCLDEKVKMYEKFGFTDLGQANSTWGGEAWHAMSIEIG